ncbi:MAG: TolB-like 6-bladed beta-propeller domain-containing protein [Paramuribaculum sp.]|nr:TolB-like 6-bladed beta-propeller domain-containing protein [Paramuribaculum sp.]
MSRFKILIAAVAVMLLWSCGHGGGYSTEVWQNERDNIEDVELVSIADSLPPMHDMSYPVGILGDTIIWYDFQSTDRLFAAYNVATDEFLGWFGKFGNGPGELANVGGEFIDKDRRILYGRNTSQWSYFGINLDEAIGNPDYDAYIKSKMISNDKKIPYFHGCYINDSTVIVDAFVPNSDWTKFIFNLGRLDLDKAEIELYDHPAVEHQARPRFNTQYNIAVSEKKDLIVASGCEMDRIILFDLDGRIKRSIYGPRYNAEEKRRKAYYSVPVVTDDRIYVIYQKAGNRRKYGKEIIELDLDGNYIRTLKSPVELVRLAYHKGTNRLYFSSVDEPQLGYVQL